MSSSHHWVLMTEKHLYVWGDNQSDQLGIGNHNYQSRPRLLKSFPCPVSPLQVALGSSHTLLLLRDGSLRSCGDNTFGQLGLGTVRTSTAGFQAVRGVPSRVVKVACGSYHSLALTADGAVYAWGSNSNGQLGPGLPAVHPLPSPVRPLSDVTDLDSGGYFSVALTRQGLLYAWGWNLHGQCGPGRPASTSPSPTLIPIPEAVQQVRCGMNHTLALTSSGSLYAWGGNSFGEQALEPSAKAPTPHRVDLGTSVPVRSLACGGYHSMALLRDGSLYSWGCNDCGQLGIGSRDHLSAPRKVEGVLGGVIEMVCGFSSCLVVGRDGLYFWGKLSKWRSYLLPCKMKQFWKSEEKISLGVSLSGVVSDWPQSHKSLSLLLQRITEEVLLLMKFQHIPKEISIQMIQILLQII